MARRRAHGEGSVYEIRDSQGKVTGWKGYVYVAGADGRRRKVYRQAKTQREAIRRLTTVEREAERGVTAPRAWSVRQFLAHWQDEVLPGSLRPGTLDTYRKLLVHADAPLGSLKLADVTGAHIQRHVSALARRYAPRTVQVHHAALHKAFEHAVRQHLIARNPAAHITLPKVERAPTRVLSTAEAARLVETARAAGDFYWPLWAVAVTTGLRRGELLGLRWEKVDIARARITVDAQRVGAELAPLKTAASYRPVPLTPLTVAALEAQRASRQAHGFVFVTREGRPLAAGSVRWFLQQALARAGLPFLSIHDLRHTYATALLHAGVPLKVVSELLGHASISQTANTYSHVSESLRASAADALHAAFSGPTTAETAAVLPFAPGHVANE